ncbi:uncharacterized protein UBRO2_01079 [Ustilago bromivora]|uniref:3-dehydroquinate dehydratase n=1 Tax=Ustilago bromivora TaxID=307758 RepID=A0A8H8TQQ6_9BASI|nr:uncharacterized protein UBRO2_01079 [Ustilago bromivora]
MSNRYGTETLSDIDSKAKQQCDDFGFRFNAFQPNHKGALVDRIHAARTDGTSAIIINAGAYMNFDTRLLNAGQRITKRYTDLQEECRQPARDQWSTILLDYPWFELHNGTTVGGGIGAHTEVLLKAFPNLKCIVQERPEVVAEAKRKFGMMMPDAVASGRVQFHSAGFFKEIKEGRNKTTYLMRMIVHDRPDAECLKTLDNVKDKMKSDSGLIILGTLLQPAVVSGKVSHKGDLVEELGEIPYPLCRSGGVIGNLVQRVDQEVNAAVNVTERTPQEFKTPIEEADLKLESILQPRSRHGIITATLL